MADLLERSDALAQLAKLAHGVSRNAGRMVLLRGEAGVGKTVLLNRFLAGLESSIPVLRGWCDPLAAPRPLGPLIDTLSGLADAQSVALATAVENGDITGMYARLLNVLRGQRQWVWVIEDAHWADGATLDLLRFIARRIQALPVLLVISYRDDELAAQHPLTVALGDIATCAALTRIDLAPLSREAVEVLAAGSGINADRLHQITGGNPFFVTEVLAAGAEALSREALPRSVTEAVWGRLGRLSDTARDTAHAVAVCGPRVDFALLEQVCVSGVASLEECLTAGVLVADEAVVRFRHELARRAALDQIPDHQRRLLHKRALAALAEPPIDPNMLAALAFHAEQAGDADAVIAHAPAAAQHAAALGAHSEAAKLYAMVLRHADATPDQQKVVWLEQHAFESYLYGNLPAAEASWRPAIALRRKLGDRLQEGDDLRWLSHILYPLGRTAEAIEAGLASLQLLEGLDPCPQLAWSLVNLAGLSTYTFDPRVAEYADHAAALGRDLGEEAVVFRARGYAAVARVFFTDMGWEELETAWRDAMGVEVLTEHAGVIGMILCWIAALHHEPTRAQIYIAETIPFCADHDLGTFQTVVSGAEALVELHRGEWARAAVLANQVLTRPELSPIHRILPLVTLALIRARRGQRAVAPLLDEAAACYEPGNLLQLGTVWAARAEAAWLAGDDATARAEAQAGLATATEHTDPWLVGHLRRWVHLAGGRPDPASDGLITPFDLEVRGEWQAAATAWTARCCPYDAAIAQLGGDITAVESALATFRGLGARAAVRRAQQRLALLRGRTPYGRRADTLADPHGLTQREREVLDLIAAGRSDTQIAAALHISPKTAAHHVSAILAKLGVDNRVQAAAHALSRQGHPVG